MSFSYSGNPQSSPRDAVRFACGDTQESSALLQDGEVDYLLSTNNNSPPAAAVKAIEAMMIRCYQLVDETVGSVSVQYSQRLGNLSKLRDMLMDNQALDGVGLPYAGGIYRSDKAANSCNPSLVQSRFRKGERHQASPEGGGGYDRLKGGAWWR